MTKYRKKPVVIEATQDYSAATRVWGFTPQMMRQVCNARGLAA